MPIRAVGEQPLTCYNAVIRPEVMERQLAAIGSPAIDGFPWQTDDLLDAEQDLRRLQAELEEPRLGATCVTDGLIGCLVVELARRCGVDGPQGLRPPASDEQLRGAVLYVDRHFGDPVTLADAAAQAHLSPNYFSERFRQLTGTSLQQYLQERRLRFARSLLGSTALTETEVCHASGFNDLSHLGRAFRRR